MENKIDKTIKPVIVGIYHDEHDEKANYFLEDVIKKKASVDLLLKASEEFGETSNPNGKKMSILCKGLFYFEKGKEETDDDKARKLLLKAITHFKKVDAKDILVKQTELHFLKRKILAEEKLRKKPNLKLWLRRAKLFKEVGNEKEYHKEMSLYYMFSTTEDMDKLSKEDILKNNDLMLDHAEKGGNPEILQKTKALYHQIKAQHTFNQKQSLDELKNAMEAIKNTSDKFGLETTETEYIMTKAMLTADRGKRNVLLKQVAERYHKSGQKMREDFVNKLLSPVPMKTMKIVYVSDQSLKKLRIIEQKLNTIKGSQTGPFAIFYYLSYMMERIKDVKRLLLRMAITRKNITELHIKENAIRPLKVVSGKPYPKRMQLVLRVIDNKREQMKQDMESLFIYGNLLLDQWSYLIGYIAGYEVPEKARLEPDYYYREFIKLFSNYDTREELKLFWNKHIKEIKENNIEVNFPGLLSILQKKDYNGELKILWNKHKKDIIWLNFHLRFFRNVFIEHLRKPWQRGNTMGTYGDDFSFHIPAPVGYVKKGEEKRMLREIYPLAPKKLRDMPDDYWEKKNLRRVLEVTLYYIDEIEKQSDREKVWNVWHKLGGSTPSYDVIGARLFNYIYTSIDTMIDFLDKYPKLVRFGKF